MKQGIVVLDFGSKLSREIAGEIRESGVYSSVFFHDVTWEEIKGAKGIILVGNKDFESKTEEIRKILSENNIPFIGILEENAQPYFVSFQSEFSKDELNPDYLENFMFNTCNCEKNWSVSEFIETQINEIRETVGTGKVILGLSGGVDSSVASVLIHRAIGDQLTCIFVDTGLLRKDEAKKVLKNYGEHFHLNIKMVDASEQFLSKLKDKSDPEEKRKIIGNEFIEVFDAEAKSFGDAEYLAQGTIYPDVIESRALKSGVAVKSHHNVGGLPEDMKLKLLEPLKELFKNEVRKVGEELGIPSEMVNRHPFPGPGLGVRILGSIDKEKVEILQEADDIFIDELYKAGLYNRVSQAFAALLPVKSVGIKEGKRAYGYTAVIRSINTVDFMHAEWSKLPYDFLDKVSNRIIAEVEGITRVVLDISSKPPGTIEWE